MDEVGRHKQITTKEVNMENKYNLFDLENKCHLRERIVYIITLDILD